MNPFFDIKPKADMRPAAPPSKHGIAAELIAVLVAVTGSEPRVLTIQGRRALPSGPFELAHRSLQSGLRAWVERQTRLPLGYVEQLYTFADRDRAGATAQHVISISYLGLTREQPASGEHEASWHSWYDYFPWEDHRLGAPPLVEKKLRPGLASWVSATPDRAVQRSRRQRAAMLFGFENHVWNEELVLQRYELLYEAGLIPEAVRSKSPTPASDSAALSATPGKSMILDHRRILATGIARLRAKIKYHPVVFELMPDTFTLLQLQRCVEALAGKLVHKPNFRRLIEQQELVEETGETSQDTGGRPAKLFRFRRTVFAERAITGTKLPISGA
ncbi:hypothetical protein V1281_000751 [Nitrobacteraceae bacterium AZCC 2161]